MLATLEYESRVAYEIEGYGVNQNRFIVSPYTAIAFVSHEGCLYYPEACTVVTLNYTSDVHTEIEISIP